MCVVRTQWQNIKGCNWTFVTQVISWGIAHFNAFSQVSSDTVAVVKWD
jgi:hypothetical protein